MEKQKLPEVEKLQGEKLPEMPDKSLIMAKATALALFIVFVTLVVIFVITRLL